MFNPGRHRKSQHPAELLLRGEGADGEGQEGQHKMPRQQGSTSRKLREARFVSGASGQSEANQLRFMDGAQRVHRVQCEPGQDSVRGQDEDGLIPHSYRNYGIGLSLEFISLLHGIFRDWDSPDRELTRRHHQGNQRDREQEGGGRRLRAQYREGQVQNGEPGHADVHERQAHQAGVQRGVLAEEAR